jgi:ketosteroid isomerase-like protein
MALEVHGMALDTETTRMSVPRMRAFFDAWQRHDVDAVVSFFSDDGCYLASGGPDDDGTTFRGREEVRRGVAAFLDMYPDGNYTDTDVVIVGNRGFATWTFHGTMRDGTRIDYRGVDILEFDGDKIRLKDAFRKARTAPIGG